MTVKTMRRIYPMSQCTVQEKIVIGIVQNKGWVLYSARPTDSAEDLDRPRHPQVHLRFNHLPFHFPRLSHESLDDQALDVWRDKREWNRLLYGQSRVTPLRVIP